MARFSCPRIHPRDANIARRARNQRRKGMLDAWSRIGDICLFGPGRSPSRRRREVNALRAAVRGPGVPKGVESAGGVRCQRDLRAKVSGFAILRLTAWRCAGYIEQQRAPRASTIGRMAYENTDRPRRHFVASIGSPAEINVARR